MAKDDIVIIDGKTNREIKGYRGAVEKAKSLEQEEWKLLGMSPELVELFAFKDSKTPEEMKQKLLEIHAKNGNIKTIEKYNKLFEKRKEIEENISNWAIEIKSDYTDTISSLNKNGIQNEINAINQEIVALKMRIDNFEENIKGKDGSNLLNMMNSRKVNEQRLSVLEKDRLILIQDLNVANEEAIRQKYISEEKLRALGIKSIDSINEEKLNENENQKINKSEKPKDDTYKGRVSPNKHKNYNPDIQWSIEENNAKKLNEKKKSGPLKRFWENLKNRFLKNKQLPEWTQPEKAEELKTPHEEFTSKLNPRHETYQQEQSTSEKDKFKRSYELGKDIAQNTGEKSEKEFYGEIEKMDAPEDVKKALIHAYVTGKNNGKRQQVEHTSDQKQENR